MPFIAAFFVGAVVMYYIMRKQGGSAAVVASKLTVKQAREILGVDDDASAAKIKKAHRELMKKLHPDQGGSDYLAQLVNAAKAVLNKDD